MDAPLRLTITLSEEDYVAFTQWYFKETPEGRRRMRLARVMGLVCVPAYLLYSAQWSTGGEIIGAGISAVMLIGAYFLLLWYLPPQLARWSLKIGARRQLLEPVSYTFDDTGILLQSAQGRGRAEWIMVRQLANAPGMIILHLGRNSAFILPKRQLVNADEVFAILNDFISHTKE